MQEMGRNMLDIILDTLLDSVKLLPFLFITYLLMEELEHKTGGKAKNRIRSAGKSGPVWGALLGVIPQCGFSAAASSLYAGHVITVGTLLAIFLSTSDEMLPIMISEAVAPVVIVKILAAKVIIGMISGLVVEFLYVGVMKKHEKEMDIHVVCEEEHCSCEDGIFRSAFKHTLKIFVYILIISFLLNVVIGFIGEDTLAGFFTAMPLVGEAVAALVGLIPNCASSVVITELYLGGIIGAGAMMSGLLVNAGVGLLVLFRLNRDWKQNAGIVAALYGGTRNMPGSGYATISRKKILEFLKKNSDRTVAVADIDHYLKAQDCEVNITTIYRYLDKLAKDGTVIKYVAEKGNQAVYQYVELGHHCEEHLHLQCVKCGKIIHLECEFMDEISEHILKDHGFKLQCKNSILYGMCSACQESK